MPATPSADVLAILRVANQTGYGRLPSVVMAIRAAGRSRRRTIRKSSTRCDHNLHKRPIRSKRDLQEGVQIGTVISGKLSSRR